MDNQIITFGCRLNAFESEAIKSAVKKSNQKNLIIFNSCAVTNEAERQLRQSIRKARKTNPQAKIVVTGCAAQINPQKYAKMAEVDLVLGNIEKTNSASYLEEADEKKPTFSVPLASSSDQENFHQDQLFFNATKPVQNFLTESELNKIKVNDIMSVKETAPQLVSYFQNQTRAFLEIQNGCNHRCTFCTIPFGRGNSRSVAFGEIVTQVKKMVGFGHQEVVLTGVDISDYGKDLVAPVTLMQMIKRLLKLVPELPRLRLSSIDVAEIDEKSGGEIFDLLANEPRFMPYLHLSLQSGDDLVLKRMKRRHTRKQVLEFCAKARQLRPEIAFGADIIAGFPTESENMFLNSVRLIEEVGIVFTHVFPYSQREGTPAARMPQVNGRIIKERARILREKGQEELDKFLSRQIGKKMSVLVEKDGMGKSENFLDVKIVAGLEKIDPGQIKESKITGKLENFLIAELVPEPENSLTRNLVKT